VSQLPLPLASPSSLEFLETQQSAPRSTDAGPIPAAARIFVNRNLRMDAIRAVGFDLDYTLAIYRQDEMDRLQTEVTLRKLIERGYPESLATAPLRSDFAIRGLHVDKQLGHVLKMDRYRYVKRAYHGHARLSRQERRRLYHSRPVQAGTKRYHWVDTLYALPEVHVYATAVEHLEALRLAEGKDPELDYSELFDDIRACIDLAHQDGSVVDVIAAHPERYIARDPQLPHALSKLIEGGKRLFLITNSGPAYSELILSYLLDGAIPALPRWRNYFDAIVCAAKKPRFFTACDLTMSPAEPDLAAPTDRFEPGRLYTGGCLSEMERLLALGGDEILYVGDHIYGDVLRAKKESAWRTMMVIQEMAAELSAHDKGRVDTARLDELDRLAEAHADELRLHLWQVQKLETAQAKKPTPATEKSLATHHKRIGRVRARTKVLDEERELLEDRIDRAFHPEWGALLKAGHEVSCFGDQVEQYACLYTDRVSNLVHYTGSHYFRGPRDRMPHEL